MSTELRISLAVALFLLVIIAIAALGAQEFGRMMAESLTLYR